MQEHIPPISDEAMNAGLRKIYAAAGESWKKDLKDIAPLALSRNVLLDWQEEGVITPATTVLELIDIIHEKDDIAPDQGSVGVLKQSLEVLIGEGRLSKTDTLWAVLKSIDASLSERPGTGFDNE